MAAASGATERRFQPRMEPRAAYGAYILQTPVLVAAALRPVPVPAGAKLALLAPLGTAA